MKSAEEWYNKMGASEEYTAMWSSHMQGIIKQIQLDALKEGMRRAARINRKNMDVWRLTKTKDMGAGAEVSALDIFMTAEQLTEKDL